MLNKLLVLIFFIWTLNILKKYQLFSNKPTLFLALFLTSFLLILLKMTSNTTRMMGVLQSPTWKAVLNLGNSNVRTSLFVNWTIVIEY